jgi:hypothetical protein
MAELKNQKKRKIYGNNRIEHVNYNFGDGEVVTLLLGHLVFSLNIYFFCTIFIDTVV